MSASNGKPVPEAERGSHLRGYLGRVQDHANQIGAVVAMVLKSADDLEREALEALEAAERAKNEKARLMSELVQKRAQLGRLVETGSAVDIEALKADAEAAKVLRKRIDENGAAHAQEVAKLREAYDKLALDARDARVSRDNHKAKLFAQAQVIEKQTSELATGRDVNAKLIAEVERLKTDLSKRRAFCGYCGRHYDTGEQAPAGLGPGIPRFDAGRKP